MEDKEDNKTDKKKRFNNIDAVKVVKVIAKIYEYLAWALFATVLMAAVCRLDLSSGNLSEFFTYYVIFVVFEIIWDLCEMLGDWVGYKIKDMKNGR